MPTPSTRTPVRIARGSYSNLNSSVSDLHDGEISYAEDQNKLYIKEGSSLVTLTFAPASPTFTGDVTFTGAANNVVFDASDNALEFADNAKASFGANADLHFIHNGTDSYIQNITGDLYIQSTSGTSDDIIITASDDVEIKVQGSDDAIKCIGDGGVELYYDNVKKFETTSNGITVSGSTLFNDDVIFAGANYNVSWDKSSNYLQWADNAKAIFGANADLQIYHDGTNNEIRSTGAIDIYIRPKDTDVGVKVIADGGVELYHDNAKKIETTSAGLKFTGGIAQVVTAAGALELDLNTSNYFTKTISGNSTFTFANPAASGQVTAFTLELTHSSGTVTWPSSVKWNADTAPTLTAGKTHLFMFVTDDGGTRYRGSALVDYVN